MSNEGDSRQTEVGDSSTYDCNVFQPLWIRCFIQTSNGLDRFLLDYGYNFLLRFGIVLWTIYLIAQVG